MNKDLVINLASRETTIVGGESGPWLNLEQEYIPNVSSVTSKQDLINMMSRVTMGESALTYLAENCTYIEMLDTKIIVTLKFYVWPHDLSMVYSLRSDLGEIGEGARVELTRSQDIVFNGTDKVNLGWLYEGEAHASMPFFSMLGARGISTPVVSFDRGIAEINESGYCVYRTNGVSLGYEHEVVMTFDKLLEVTETIDIRSQSTHLLDKPGIPGTLTYYSWGDDLVRGDPEKSIEVTLNDTGLRLQWEDIVSGTLTVTYMSNEVQAITNLENSVFAEWVDDEGEPQTSTLRLQIPECVQALLATCEDGTPKYEWAMCGGLYGCDGAQEYRYYYNTCDGHKLAAYWSSKNG